jgi:acetoin:2,6-dichlorophenolindophenol oxidoreductase subunit alpha
MASRTVSTQVAPAPADTPAQELTRLTDEDLMALLLIRHFESRLLSLFADGQVNGTTHTCLGQEHIPVALMPLFDPSDFIFSNHRGHGHYLARFRDPAGLLAEIMGRDGAVCRGVGGSQHILRGSYLSTGIQGASLPAAAGVALHFRKNRQQRLAVAFIGDGTWGEGAVYEALNMAQLWSLPLAVIVEHNGIAQSTPTRLHMAGTVADRAAAFGIRHYRTDSTGVNEIRAAVAPLLRAARTVPHPVILEFAAGRLGPHSKGDDTRDPADIARLRERDWYTRYENRFPDQFRTLDAEAARTVDEVVRTVDSSGPSQWTPR